MRTGETGVARELLLKLSQSNDPAVLASTARLLGRLKEFDACVQALNKALAQQIAAELLVARGLCQHGRGKDVAALEDFEHAQQQDESFAAAHYYVGMHWKQAGEPGKAKKALERTVELAGDAGIGRAARRALGRL